MTAGSGYDKVGGASSSAGDLLGLPNVTALRNHPGGVAKVVALRGYTQPEGYQDLFQWQPANGVDDGVTRFNQGGLGSNQPGWKRVYSGALNVRWGGAEADGSESQVGIQRTIDAAIAQQAISPDGQVSQPDVFFPVGRFFIGASIDFTNYFGRVYAEGAVLETDDDAIDMVIGIGKNMLIRGIALEGGANGFVIDTNNLDAVVINIENVQTRGLAKAAIKASLDSDSTILNVTGSRFLFEDTGSEVAFDHGTLGHVNFVNCWVTSFRDTTWYNRLSRLHIRGGIFVPGEPTGTDYWIQNENGSVWLFQNMFSGETARPILLSAAPANAFTVVSVEIHDNILQAPSEEGGRGPFTFTAIPNEISIKNNVGLLGITQNSGLGIEVSGYALLGAQSYIDTDSQYCRQFSAGSNDLVRNTFLARMRIPELQSALGIPDAGRTLEYLETGSVADYGEGIDADTTISTTTNPAGQTVLVSQASADGQHFALTYSSALSGLPDGCYTLIASITVAGPASELILFAGDVVNRWHLAQGRHVIALPFVWEDGTTQDSISVTCRDLPNGNDIFSEPLQIVAGHVATDARFYANAAPVGNSGYRWLKGTVLWESNPTSGQFIGRVCTTTSARIAAKLYGPGTWKTFGAIS